MPLQVPYLEACQQCCWSRGKCAHPGVAPGPCKQVSWPDRLADGPDKTGGPGGLPGRLVCDRKSPVPPPGISTQALSPRKEPDSGELGNSRAGQGKSKTSSWEHHVGPKVRKRSENSRMGVNAEPAARCPLASAAHRRPSVQQ